MDLHNLHSETDHSEQSSEHPREGESNKRGTSMVGMCIPALAKILQLRPPLIVPTGRISEDLSIIEPGNQRIGSRAFQRASGHPKRTSIDEVMALQRW